MAKFHTHDLTGWNDVHPLWVAPTSGDHHITKALGAASMTIKKLILVIAVFFVANAQGQQVKISTLPSPFTIMDMNNSGNMVLSTSNAFSLWDGSGLTALPMDYAGTINDQGVVLGSSSSGALPQYVYSAPAYYLNGKLNKLNFPTLPLPQDQDFPSTGQIGMYRYDNYQGYSGFLWSIDGNGLLVGTVERYYSYKENCYYPNNPGAACGVFLTPPERTYYRYYWDGISESPVDPKDAAITGIFTSTANHSGQYAGLFDIDPNAYLTQADREAGWRVDHMFKMVSSQGFGYGVAYNAATGQSGLYSFDALNVPEPQSGLLALAGLACLLYRRSQPKVERD